MARIITTPRSTILYTKAKLTMEKVQTQSDYNIIVIKCKKFLNEIPKSGLSGLQLSLAEILHHYHRAPTNASVLLVAHLLQ